jgi:hypothetical protein
MFIILEEPDTTDELIAKMKAAAVNDMPEHSAADTPGVATYSHVDRSLPFEMRMLEIALEEACQMLGIEVKGVVNSGKQRIVMLEAEKSSVRPCVR